MELVTKHLLETAAVSILGDCPEYEDCVDVYAQCQQSQHDELQDNE